MQTHKITIETGDWKETDPQEDRYVTVNWLKLDSLFCVACGSRGLYTQPWAPGRESYFVCTACGVELISKEIESVRSSDHSWSKAFLSRLRALDGIVEWKSSEHLKTARPNFEGTYSSAIQSTEPEERVRSSVDLLSPG